MCIHSAFAAAAALCVALSILLLLELLLLFAMVCRMAKLLMWFVESDSSVFFHFIQTRLMCAEPRRAYIYTRCFAPRVPLRTLTWKNRTKCE